MSWTTMLTADSTEYQRRIFHLKLWNMYRCEVRRTPWGGELEGAFGYDLMEQIRAVIAGGREDEHGRMERHELMANHLALSVHVQQQVADTQGIVHRAPIEITGAMGDSTAIGAVREAGGYDATLMEADKLSIAVGVCGVRPVIEPGHPVGLTVVAPHAFIAFHAPGNKLRPLAVIEFLQTSGDFLGDGPCRFWSVVDPKNPRYELWEKASDLLSEIDGKPKGRPKRFRNGPTYPWRWRGLPLLPWTLYHGEEAPTELMPVPYMLYHGTNEVILENTRLKWHKAVTAADHLYLVANGAITGHEQASTNYGRVTVLRHTSEGGSVQGFSQPNGIAAAEGIGRINRAEAAQWASRYNRALRAREDKGAQSGAAIQLEMHDLYQWWKSRSTQTAPLDAHVLRTLVSSHNFAVRAGLIQGPLIMEADFGVYHVAIFTPDERRRMLEDIREAIDLGAATAIDYYMALNGMRPSQRKQAEKDLVELGQEKIRLMLAGVITPTAAMVDGKRQVLLNTNVAVALDRDRLLGETLAALDKGGVPVDAVKYIQARGLDIPMMEDGVLPAIRNSSPADAAAATALSTLKGMDVAVDVERYCREHGIPLRESSEMGLGAAPLEDLLPGEESPRGPVERPASAA